MDTLSFAYECARKQGSLDHMSLPELVDCGKCAAEVINADKREFDVKSSKSCGVCFNRISKDIDIDEAPKAMNEFVGCCGNSIKRYIEEQPRKQAPAEPQPQPQRRTPPDQEHELTEPPLNAREDIYDLFEHDLLLPRKK